MASLSEKTSTLGYVNAMHLLRRTTCKPSKAMATSFASLTPAQALNQLFSYEAPAMYKPIKNSNGTAYFPDAANLGVTYDGTYDGTYAVEGINYWLYNSVMSNTIQWKLGLFLHSIFINSYTYVSMTYDYMSLLNLYTNKSLKELAYKLTLNQSMLYYLSNNSNTSTSPNQNYAREFLELFTILKGPQVSAGDYTNYTEHDVQQAARILSGFRATYGLANRMNYLDLGLTANTAGHKPNPTNGGWTFGATNIPTGYCTVSLHDSGSKTFSTNAFGGAVINGSNSLTGSYTVYDELQALINMIFSKDATAKNYARRIYRFFVKSEITAEVESDIIAPLAANLLSTQNGITYNLEAAVKLLLKSTHFYDEDDSIVRDEAFGGKVKSPMDLILNFMNESSMTLPSPTANPTHFHNFFANIRSHIYTAGFQLFDSVDVSGYPGYSDGPTYDKNWVTIATLNRRYYSGWVELLITGYTNNSYVTKLDVPEFVRTSGNFSDASNPTTFLSELFDMYFASNPKGLRYGYFEHALLNGLSHANWAATWNAWKADFTNTTKKNAVKIPLERLFKAMLKSVEYQVM